MWSQVRNPKPETLRGCFVDRFLGCVCKLRFERRFRWGQVGGNFRAPYVTKMRLCVEDSAFRPYVVYRGVEEPSCVRSPSLTYTFR